MSYSMKVIVFVMTLFLLSACGDQTKQPTLSPLSEGDVILAFGDSLTFGTGSRHQTESYPSIVESLSGLTVVNAGIPGEVSSTGLQRLPKLLEQTKPKLVILCHGGNDMIRRLGQDQLKQNLEQMVQLSVDSGADVVLIAVPSFSLTLDIPELYQEVANQYQLPIESDVLADILSDRSLKSDQVHPNANGYKVLAEKIYSVLQNSQAL